MNSPHDGADDCAEQRHENQTWKQTYKKFTITAIGWVVIVEVGQIGYGWVEVVAVFSTADTRLAVTITHVNIRTLPVNTLNRQEWTHATTPATFAFVGEAH